ncbi:unnamed protein product [Rotaria sp. Silwood1]|nr:unnamed protein product [Rotaria sp. Silwood1]CAF4909990.1 unnamed protein product [Rotaria sp. Silwood1]
MHYQSAYSNNSDASPWVAITKARNVGAYIQDEFNLESNFTLTYGVRFDMPYIANEGSHNDLVDGMTFVDEKGNAKKLSTSKVPKPVVMINPRVGFNYDINGDKSVQVRGGIGMFTGRPPFVFISNQMGNNGVMSGDYISSGNASGNFAFSPKIPQSLPVTITPGTVAPTFSIAPTDENFKFAKILRSNLAVDAKLFGSVIGSAEILYTQNINAIYYYNANLKPSTATNIDGTKDDRAIFNQLPNGTLNASNQFPTVAVPSSNLNRINTRVTDAITLKSGPLGGSFMTTLKLEKPIKSQGFGWMAAYTFGYSRDYVDASSTQTTSYNSNKSINGNNNVGIAFSDYDTRNRLITNINYRKELNKNVAVQFSLFYEGRNQGRFSYTYSGDRNGDGVGSNNDLLYIPTASEVASMKFETYTPSGGTSKSQAMQREALENYISQDKYLSRRRGEYAERNGVLMPTINRFDISAVVELSRFFGKEKHTLQLRADIFNVGNLINSNSGVSYVANATSPIQFRAIDNATNLPVYRMVAVGDNINYSTYRKGTGIGDVWQAQFGIRYIF